MGTEQDGKEAFSDSPRDPAVLAHPTTPHPEYTTTSHPATSLSAAHSPGQPQVVYGVVAGSPDLKPAHVLTPMVASAASQHQVQYLVNTKGEVCEDMDVVNTLAELHRAPVHAPYRAAQTITELHSTSSPYATAHITNPYRSESPHLSSKTSQLMIITQDEDGGISIQKNDNVSLEKGEEKMLKKIAKTAAVRPLKADKDAAYASLDQEIMEYMVKYEGDEATKKITMRDLRHVIPLLIMRCYAISEEPYQRKVRGMWAEKPPEWPTHIPYCDPNNKKDMGKPKKSTLLQMFIYLKDHYTANYGPVLEEYKARRVAQHQVSALSPATPSPATPSPAMDTTEMIATITPSMPTFSGPSTALAGHQHAAVTTTTFTSAHPLLVDRDSPLPSPPPPSRDPLPTNMTSLTELKQDWDPESESIDRIHTKVQGLNNYAIIPDDERSMLFTIRDVLSKMYQVRSQDHVFFLEIAHEFEASLDIIRVMGTFPEKSRTRWCEFYEKHVVPDIAASEQIAPAPEVLDTTEDRVMCEPLGVGREEEVATGYNSIVIPSQDAKPTQQEAPPHYFNTFPSELEGTVSDSYLSHDHMDQNNKNITNVDDFVAQHNQVNTASEAAFRKVNELVTSELGALLTTSLHMTECEYASSPDVQPPPASVNIAFQPANMSPLHDPRDEAVFPLSSPYADHMPSPEIYSELMIAEPVDMQPPIPSTNMVTTGMATRSNTSELIQQEEQMSFLNININKLKIRKDSQPDTEKVKSMAQAYYNLNKKKELQKPQTPPGVGPGKVKLPPARSTPPQVLIADFNQVIPVVVEDMENEVVVVQQHNPKKRRMLKRPYPSSTLTKIQV